jgi:hypothetical protein
VIALLTGNNDSQTKLEIPMQPQNQNELDLRVTARLKVMRILWLALVISIGLYFLLVVLVAPKDGSPNPTLSFALAGMGVFCAILSFLLKQRYWTQAVDQQNPSLVQTGFIIAMAFCEVPALFGLIDRFVTANRYFFVLFVIAVVADVFHFPRRQPLLDASYKNSNADAGPFYDKPVAGQDQTRPPFPPEF